MSRGRSGPPPCPGGPRAAGGSWALWEGPSHSVLHPVWPAQHVVDRAHTVTVPHLCNVLLAFAHLNFRPEREDKFFGLVWSVHLFTHPGCGGREGSPDPGLQG